MKFSLVFFLSLSCVFGIAQNQPIIRYGFLSPKEAAKDITIDTVGVMFEGFFATSNVRSLENIDQCRMNQHLAINTQNLKETQILEIELPVSLFMESGKMEYSGKWRSLFAKAYPELNPFFKQSDYPPAPQALLGDRRFIRKNFNTIDMEAADFRVAIDFAGQRYKADVIQSELYAVQLPSGNAGFKLDIKFRFKIPVRPNRTYTIDLKSIMPASYYANRRQIELGFQELRYWAGAEYVLDIEYDRRQTNCVIPEAWTSNLGGLYRNSNAIRVNTFYPENDAAVLFFQQLPKAAICSPSANIMPPNWYWNIHPGFRILSIEGNTVPAATFVQDDANIVLSGLYTKTTDELLSFVPNTAAFKAVSKHIAQDAIQLNCMNSEIVSEVQATKGLNLGYHISDTLTSGEKAPSLSPYSTCWEASSPIKRIEFELDYLSRELLIATLNDKAIQSVFIEPIELKPLQGKIPTIRPFTLEFGKQPLPVAIETDLPAGKYALTVTKVHAGMQTVCLSRLEFGWANIR